MVFVCTILHTNNVSVRHIKNFLEPLKVNEVIQNLVKRGLTQSALDALELHFRKSLPVETSNWAVVLLHSLSLLRTTTG